MNKLERTRPNALAPSDYATFELAKANDDVIGGSDIAQIRSYGALIRAQAEGIKAVIANMDDADDITATKSEMNETAMTCSKVSLFCDIRIGELLRKLPKGKGNQYTSAPDIIVTKADAIEESGITPTMAKNLQRLATHVDVVEQVIQESEEKGEIVSRNKVLKAIKEQEQPKVRRCSVCGTELNNDNAYVDHKSICKKCYNARRNTQSRKWQHPTIENDEPEWTIDTLIADLTANAPTWRDTVTHTFAMYAEYGVEVSQESVDAINSAFNQLDSAIAAIVEG